MLRKKQRHDALYDLAALEAIADSGLVLEDAAASNAVWALAGGSMLYVFPSRVDKSSIHFIGDRPEPHEILPKTKAAIEKVVHEIESGATGLVYFNRNDHFASSGCMDEEGWVGGLGQRSILKGYYYYPPGADETYVAEARLPDIKNKEINGVTLHEGLHAVGRAKGWPGRIFEEKRFLTEYEAFYEQCKMTGNYKYAPVRTFTAELAVFLKPCLLPEEEPDATGCAGLYEHITHIYDENPSFKARVAMIIHALEKGVHISPEQAVQIALADTDAAAQTLVDQIPIVKMWNEIEPF
jgi:hypothetical protein